MKELKCGVDNRYYSWTVCHNDISQRWNSASEHLSNIAFIKMVLLILYACKKPAIQILSLCYRTLLVINHRIEIVIMYY